MQSTTPRPKWQIPTFLGCLTGLAIIAAAWWLTFS